ncbi:MAG TPA: XRE family transcriptional regulator [Ignavibacteria bacterium]|nr:XRE family transcriptional regulator [Ignavibacteria bacterium]
MNKIKKAADFQKYLKEQLKNKKIKEYYDEYDKQLKIAYQIIQLRKKKKMSQSELAKKIGTTQSNIARMESGQQNFTIEILYRVAKALNRNLKVSI